MTEINAAVIALGNRMATLKQSPGFNDLRLLAEMLEKEATAELVDYPGWDAMQISVLKARAQAAKELVAELFARVDGAIANAEMALNIGNPQATINEQTRIAGSY